MGRSLTGLRHYAALGARPAPRCGVRVLKGTAASWIAPEIAVRVDVRATLAPAEKRVEGAHHEMRTYPLAASLSFRPAESCSLTRCFWNALF